MNKTTAELLYKLSVIGSMGMSFKQAESILKGMKHHQQPTCFFRVYYRNFTNPNAKVIPSEAVVVCLEGSFKDNCYKSCTRRLWQECDLYEIPAIREQYEAQK